MESLESDSMCVCVYAAGGMAEDWNNIEENKGSQLEAMGEKNEQKGEKTRTQNG